MNADEYRTLFAGKKGKEAFKVALDNRKFEIELYWKRATYFWTFIAATFAGYGFVQNLSLADDKEFMSFFLSCLGFILAVAWLLANRGSKQWQENWEHHVDHLEDEITGPLYKTTLLRQRPKGFWLWADWLAVGPSAHSVSKINQLISAYIAVIWLILVVRSPKSWSVTRMSWFELAILSTTIVALGLLLFFARTHVGPHSHEARLRTSNIK